MAIPGADDPEGEDRRSGPGCQDRRSCREPGPATEESDGDAIRAVAPVHQQRHDLVPVQHPEHLPEVLPGDLLDAPAAPLLVEELEQLFVCRVVGHRVDRPPAARQPGGGRFVVAEVSAHDDEPLRRLPRRVEGRGGIVADLGGAFCLGEPRESHQLQDPADLVPVHGPREVADAPVAGRDAEHTGGVGPDIPAPGRPRPVHADGEPAADAGRRSKRQAAQDPRPNAVAEHSRAGPDAPPLGLAPVRGLEAALGPASFGPGLGVRRPVGGAGDPAGGGHLAAAFSAPLAKVRRVRATGFSVPTSVSLSSPRMNASTRLKAMSSWICCGGLFMK